MKQRRYCGYGSHQQLPEVLQKFSPRKIFYVTGKDSYHLSGGAELFHPAVSQYEFVRFCDFAVNPKLADIRVGMELFQRERCDFVLGVGGGSVMDVAKAVAILTTQDSAPERLVRGEAPLTPRAIPTVMIPTTAGAGSEATHFSVIYLDQRKYSLAHLSMQPDVAILEPALLRQLPRQVAACSGIDALCHGIEALWSLNATAQSREYSLRAIELASAHLVSGVNLASESARQQMMMAAYWAGRAINIAKTTAAHAVSYALTALFGIPHGQAVALSLPHFVEFNWGRGQPSTPGRTREAMFAALGVSTAAEAADWIRQTMAKINLATQLSHLDLPTGASEKIEEYGFNEQRMKNNPRPVSEKDYLRILEAIK